MRVLVPLLALAGLVLVAPLASADPAPPPILLCALDSDIGLVSQVLHEGCYVQECVRWSYLKVALLRRCAGL